MTTEVDTALTAIHRFGFDYGHGFSDHSPMVIEALEFADRSDHIAGWLERYLPRLNPSRPAAEIQAIESAERECTRLGWKQFARRELHELADAAPSGAGHGVLRAAHALRSLRRHDSPPRRAELARAFANWRLCALNVAPRIRTTPSVHAVAAAPSAQRVLMGLEPSDDLQASSFTDMLRLVLTPELCALLYQVSLPTETAEAAATLTSAAAESMRQGPKSSSLALLHGFTTAVALRDLLDTESQPTGDPNPGDPVNERLFRSMLVTIAGLRVGYGGNADHEPPSPHEPASQTSEPVLVEPGSLIDAALAHGDEHAIKLAVALSAEEGHRGHAVPALRSAVQRSLTAIGVEVGS